MVWATAAWALREIIQVLRNGGVGFPPASITTRRAADGESVRHGEVDGWMDGCIDQSLLEPMNVRACLPGRDQHICTVFPRRLVERLMFAGFSAQVHVKHGQAVSQDLVAQKHGKGAATTTPRVGGVLGAGNLSIIPLLDIVHMLVMENATVVCKMNQVRPGGCVSLREVEFSATRIVPRPPCVNR